MALDNCTYDARTAQPVEGSVVDADEDLVELCSRIQQGDNRHCAILFCEEEAPLTPRPAAAGPPSSQIPSARPAPFPRPYTH